MSLSPLLWLAIGFICIGAEIIVPGFVIFWFGIGALITSAGIYIGIIVEEPWYVQWFVFFLSSLGFMLAWHFYFKKFFQKSDESEERDPTLKNLKGKVVKAIMPHIPGEVELYSPYHGIKKWQAEADEVIEEGEEVTVMEARGIRLYVAKNNK